MTYVRYGQDKPYAHSLHHQVQSLLLTLSITCHCHWNCYYEILCSNVILKIRKLIYFIGFCLIQILIYNFHKQIL